MVKSDGLLLGSPKMVGLGVWVIMLVGVFPISASEKLNAREGAGGMWLMV